MKGLLKTYTEVFNDLTALNNKLNSLYKQIETLKAEYSYEVSEAKNKLSEKLSENAQHTAKVNAFKEIAKTHSNKHITASNAKNYDSGVLSRLSVQISSGLENDPFAVQLYTEATAQLIFLKSQEAVFTKNNAQYLETLSIRFNAKTHSINREISSTKIEIISYLNSEFFSNFLSSITKDNLLFNTTKGSTEIIENIGGTISLGTIDLPFPIPTGMESDIANKTTGICNVAKATIKVPANISINKGRVILAEYTNTSENILLKGIQNIILNIARHYGELFSQVSFIDPIRYNSSSLGCLSGLCGNGCFIDTVPRSEEFVRKRINSIVSSIDLKGIDPANRKVYIFHDFPQAYDAKSISLIQQLCANAEYYGFLVILTHNSSARQQSDSNSYQFIRNLALNLSVNNSDMFFYTNEKGDKYSFEWYSAPAQLPIDIERKYIHERPVIDLDNNYIKRVGLEFTPNTKKGVRKLDNIPYGIDNNGNILYLDFENSNFATYICGAARSGKSTLLHTIITGILQSTHPDNVEIWLVDFGKTEFSRYVNKDIPHIRYIILDESPELVYDLVDRLTEIMQSRQNKFMGKWEKLKDVPKEQYMPELFVVIDEFSIMSNILSNSITMAKEDYRIKLQTILAKGAKLGMRFIFSSQGFTEGTRGLTQMAKDQIQQRIAMKAEYNDIKSTLDLKTISERDELLMEQLPVHYALNRIPLTEQGDRLNNVHVLYIPSAEDQVPLIETLKTNFTSEKVYNPEKFESYIYKRPMFKDGNAFEIFDEQKDVILGRLRKSENNDDGSFSIYIGSPQRMLQVYPIEIVSGFCENGLIISPTREKITSTSLIISATESLKLQKIQVECWTPNRNPVYRQITNDCNYSFDKSFIMIEDICERISQLKYAIEKKIESNIVVFIMNYESIMMDMQYLAEESASKEKVDLGVLSEYGSITREEGEMDLNTLLDLELESNSITPIKSSVTVQVSTKVVASTVDSKLYDARNDLKYILTHGPRYGYHFIMQFDTCGDFRQTKLDESLFRHKIMFQTAKNEAVGIVNSAFAQSVSTLSNHIFRYTNGIDDVSFRPYLHPGVCIDGWTVQGQNIDNIVDEEDYLE